MDHWTINAKEDFFNMLDQKIILKNKINSNAVCVKESLIIPGQNGVFAQVDIPKGNIIEWGIATIIPNMNVQENDLFYTWGSDRKTAATTSGCGLFYNTLGDQSNARCVPYHSEFRFEIYALKDIKKNEEITIRYDSMNYRNGMQHLLPIVGALTNGDQL